MHFPSHRRRHHMKRPRALSASLKSSCFSPFCRKIVRVFYSLEIIQLRDLCDFGLKSAACLLKVIVEINACGRWGARNKQAKCFAVDCAGILRESLQAVYGTRSSYGNGLRSRRMPRHRSGLHSAFRAAPVRARGAAQADIRAVLIPWLHGTCAGRGL